MQAHVANPLSPPHGMTCGTLMVLCGWYIHPYGLLGSVVYHLEFDMLRHIFMSRVSFFKLL